MIDFANHTFAFENTDNKIRSYHVPDLWNHVRDYEVITIDLVNVIQCINTYINNFTADDWTRVMYADLTYPIIINDVSGIADGCHRTVKAMMLGYTQINAVRIVDFPEPTRVWDNWEDYDKNP